MKFEISEFFFRISNPYQPDMTIMAVNTFVKDCDDPNPLIRALAVRTMGCIRVGKFEIHRIEILTRQYSR